ncbi:MAG: DUF5320 domain-containing protein [Holophagae bacterium]
MPGGDGTGPMGMGAMTGWGRGPCRGSGWAHVAGGGFRRPGRGAGGGLGWRHRFWAGEPSVGSSRGAGFDRLSERRWLEHRAAELDDELGRIRARLDELASTDNLTD